MNPIHIARRTVIPIHPHTTVPESGWELHRTVTELLPYLRVAFELKPDEAIAAIVIEELGVSVRVA